MTVLDWAQFGAIVAAAAFFIVKFAFGYFNPNISLSGETQRSSRRDGLDDLLVAMTVAKGGIGNVDLYGASVCASWPGGHQIEQLQGMAQVEIKKTESKRPGEYTPKYRIVEPWQGKTYYNLPPGASSILSCHVEVPTAKTCTVQVVIIGRQPLHFGVRQWRASLISLPSKEPNSDSLSRAKEKVEIISAPGDPKYQRYHGRSISWISVIIIIIGFIVGGAGLMLGPTWWVFGGGAGLAVLGCIIALGSGIFNDWY